MPGCRPRLGRTYKSNSLPTWVNARGLRQMHLLYQRNQTKTDRQGKHASKPRAIGRSHTRYVVNTERKTEASTVPEFPVVERGVTQALLLSWPDRKPLGGTRDKQSQDLGGGSCTAAETTLASVERSVPPGEAGHAAMWGMVPVSDCSLGPRNVPGELEAG